MTTAIFQEFKFTLMQITGLSKDALHIYTGLMVFLISAFLLHKSLRNVVPWFIVLLVALVGEFLDIFDYLPRVSTFRWGEALHDILNTLFWPSVILILARFGVLFGDPD